MINPRQFADLAPGPPTTLPDGLTFGKNSISIYQIAQDTPDQAFTVFAGPASFGMSTHLRTKYQTERIQIATQAFAMQWVSATRRLVGQSTRPQQRRAPRQLGDSGDDCLCHRDGVKKEARQKLVLQCSATTTSLKA